MALWADPIEVWRLVSFIQLLLTTSPNHGLVHSNSSSNEHGINKYICNDRMTERLHRSSQAVHNSHPLYRKVEGSIHAGGARRVFSRQCQNSLRSGRTRWVIILQRWSGVLGSDKVALWADPIEVWRLVSFISNFTINESKP